VVGVPRAYRITNLLELRLIWQLVRKTNGLEQRLNMQRRILQINQVIICN